MKIYLASMFSTKDIIKKYAAILKKDGHTIMSSWLREKLGPNTKMNDVTPRYLRTHAQKDLEDINEADVLVLFTVDPEKPTKRGGRHVEFGYALGTCKELIIVGPKENIFHYLPEVVQVNTFQELRDYLKFVSREQ